MCDTTIKSKKKSLKKLFTIILIVTFVVVILFGVISILDFAKYYRAQERIINLLFQLDEKGNLFNTYPLDLDGLIAEGDRGNLIYQLYEYFEPEREYKTIMGKRYCVNEGILNLAATLDFELGDILYEEGYGFDYASDYLEYSNYFEYIFRFEFVIYTVLVILLLLIVIFYIVYRLRDKKISISIENGIVTYTRANGKVNQFFVDDIKSVELISSNGLKIKSTGGIFKIRHLDNTRTLKEALIETISTIKENVAISQTHNNGVEDLEKYKELFDKGIITQEEFEAKKRQLLGF